MNSPTIDFPVIGFGHGGIVAFVKSRDELRKCLRRGYGLTVGLLIGVKLVGIDGRSFEITDFKISGVAKPWWRRPLLFMRFYWVDLEIIERESVGLDELKNLLRKAYKANTDMWDGAFGEFSEFDAELMKCESFEDISRLV